MNVSISTKTRNWIIGIVSTAIVAIAGFLGKQAWEVYSDVQKIKATMTAERAANQENEDAQWRILYRFDSKKEEQNEKIELMHLLQTEFILPSLVKGDYEIKDLNIPENTSKKSDVSAEEYRQQQLRTDSGVEN